MKRFFVIGVLSFFLIGAGGSSDVLEGLQSFEKSLSEWMASLNEMDERIANIENNAQAEEALHEELTQSNSNIEAMISGLVAKVEKVENMGSIEGVRDILKSYEGTLNVFKNRFSDMAKKVEDLEVKTAVLERIYQTSQKPVETLMKAIDEQKATIDLLSERLNSHDKTFLSIKENLSKKTVPHESITKTMDELNSRLAKIEKSGIVVVRTGQKEKVKNELREELNKELKEVDLKGQKRAGDEVRTQEEEKIVSQDVFQEKPKLEEGITDVGRGFFVKNVIFGPFGSSTSIKGKIINKSDSDYGSANFKVAAYDKGDVPLGGHGFTIRGFKKGSTKDFEEVIVGVAPEKIAKYSVHFKEDTYMLTIEEDTGARSIKIIERKLEDAKAVQDGQSQQSEDEGVIGGDEKIDMEGFVEIGNGFYVRKLFFTSFGSSTRVSGEIRNNSKEDYIVATFVMKIYSERYGMLTQFDFSIRRLKSGQIKPFDEIITGIRPVDIFKHEIVHKKPY